MLTLKNINRLAEKELPDGPILVMVLVLAIYLGAGWLLASRVYHLPGPDVDVSYGQNFIEPTPYHNLDLRVATHLKFETPAITMVKDLGESEEVDHQIIGFKVPADNLTEYGLMSLPTTPKPAGGYPLIILCHAYYNPAKYDTQKGYLSDMDFYSQHGFVVIKPDYRGQGLSRGVGRPEGAYYSMAYNNDIMSLIAAAKSTGYISRQDINLWGHSMGAYIALRAAVISKDVRSVVLLSGPVGKFDDMYKIYKAPSDLSNPVAGGIRQTQLIQHGTPLTNPNYWANISPLNFLANSKASFQIHVGLSDKVVPPQFSTELDLALGNYNMPHHYYAYRGAKHSLTAQRPLIWSRSLQVLASN